MLTFHDWKSVDNGQLLNKLQNSRIIVYGFRQKAIDEPGLYLTVERKLNNWEDKGYVRKKKKYIYIYFYIYIKLC